MPYIKNQLVTPFASQRADVRRKPFAEPNVARLGGEVMVAVARRKAEPETPVQGLVERHPTFGDRRPRDVRREAAIQT